MYSSSVTIDQVIDALAAFLDPFMNGGAVVRAQVNRVPLPTNPCAVLTELRQYDLNVPFMGYDPLNNEADIQASRKVDIQIDFYGDQAGDMCNAVKMAFRCQYGFENFPSNIKPLYTDDGIQSPLISGEEQYVSRWSLTAVLQYNPIVTVPQQFADEAYVTTLQAVDVIEVL